MTLDVGCISQFVFIMKSMNSKILILSLIAPAIFQTAVAKDINLKSFGAKADGKTKVTVILQKAIDEVSKSGGGRVVLMDGIYLTGPVQLKDGVDLHIDGTAKLIASPDIADYPEWPDPKHIISENLPRGNRNACLIFADEAERIAITGRGVIDGNGTFHVRKKDTTDKHRWQYERIYPNEQSLPRMVFFAGCKDVLIEDVTMTNQPAGWSYWLHDCDRVTIRGLQILADVTYPNNDGIDLNCCRDVTVSDCHIECGDDAIIVRANSRSLHENKPMERVTVTNCLLRSGSAAIRVGWTNDGVIRHCSFSNIVMTDTYTGISIRIPPCETINTDWGREETLIEDMAFSNITMDGIFRFPIQAWVTSDPGTKVEAIRDIRFSNIHSKGSHFPYFWGRENNLLRNFSFDQCSFICEKDSDEPELELFKFVEGFVFNNVTFTESTVPVN